MQGPYPILKSFNKRIMNPLILKFAGRTRSPFAVVHHVGRRSGKPYSTPIIVQRNAQGFVMALTYGPEVDWYRNLQAAGRATLLWHGREYAIGKPEPLDVEAGLSAFPPLQRKILRARGTQDFVMATPQAGAQAA